MRRIVLIAITAILVVTVLASAGCASAKPQVQKAGYACPTRQGTVNSYSIDGLPSGVVVPAGDLTAPENAVRVSLQNEAKYLLTTGAMDYNGQTDEVSVRQPAMAAYALGVALKTNGYAPSITGIDNSVAKEYVAKLVHQVACNHIAVASGVGWGHQWQSNHWAYMLGTAAWTVWSNLSATDKENVTAMIANEANWRAGIDPKYWASGDIVNYPGDTKAEEDAWNSTLLMLAYYMMPTAPNAALWRKAAVQYQVAAYAKKSDNYSSNTEVINGVLTKTRVSGYNVYSGGYVENHSIISPDYANQIQLVWQAADLAGLSDNSVPEAVFHDANKVYNMFSTYSFTPGSTTEGNGTYNPPGGTIYIPGSTQYYLPQGGDWTEPAHEREALWVSLDAHAYAYGAQVGATTIPAFDSMALHEQGQTDLQANSGATDGRTYPVDPDLANLYDTYPAREEYAAHNLAAAWLAIYVKYTGVPSVTTGTIALP